MRSMHYILGGKPSNTSDCIDYGLKHRLTRIILTLQVVEEASEQYIVRWLRGAFVWFFDDQTVTYTMTFGGCFMHEPIERQRLSVDNANERLSRELAVIAAPRGGAAPVSVEGAEARFDYSMVCQPADRE